MKDLIVGDMCTILQGEKVPVDGIVVEGEGWCDESLMTGESLPRRKGENSAVLGGSILSRGQLVVRATVTMDQMALSRILDLVEGDLERKSIYTRAADRVVRWFVPAVITLAGAVGLLSSWIDAVSVLLISCPCAIGIAAPLAEAELMSALVGMGAIVRNRACLPLLAKITTYVFDKTGTITYGEFKLISGMERLTSNEKGVLKSMTAKSNHPISQALLNEIDCELMEIPVKEIPGSGLQFEGYKLGSRAFTGMSDHADAVTTVFFTHHEELLTTFKLGDRMKPETREVVDQLSSKTLLLSGDGQAVVKVIAGEGRFNSYKAECTPLDKRIIIDELKEKGEIVCMVGDGINDAPALTAAHVGISVVSATDISIQVSDILLTTDKLTVLAELRKLGKLGQRVLNQNLFWAFFYNVIGIGLAVAGLLTPLYAAGAMILSSLIVTANSKRIRR